MLVTTQHRMHVGGENLRVGVSPFPDFVCRVVIENRTVQSLSLRMEAQSARTVGIHLCGVGGGTPPFRGRQYFDWV